MEFTAENAKLCMQQYLGSWHKCWPRLNSNAALCWKNESGLLRTFHFGLVLNSAVC